MTDTRAPAELRAAHILEPDDPGPGLQRRQIRADRVVKDGPVDVVVPRLDGELGGGELVRHEHQDERE